MLVFPATSELPEDLLIVVEDDSLFLPWLAVLASQRIAYRVEYQEGKTCLIVPAGDALRAKKELALHAINTADWKKAHSDSEEDKLRFSWLSFWIATVIFSLLLRFHQAVQESPSAWRQRGVWNAGLIRGGEYWRCLTALTLHGDYAHLLGNLFWGGMLLTLTATEFGNGTALFMMLLAGGLGNAINAWIFPQAEYQALGASTMVFAMLGILVGRATLKVRQQQAAGRGIMQQFRLCLPLLAGFALLAITGTAPGSDLAGHLSGFLVGIAFGLIAHRQPQQMKNNLWQTILAMLALIAIPLAWSMAWK